MDCLRSSKLPLDAVAPNVTRGVLKAMGRMDQLFLFQGFLNSRVSVPHMIRVIQRSTALAPIQTLCLLSGQTCRLYGDAATLDIDGAGVISGTSAAACILSGQVTIIDAAFNTYNVALDLTNCAGLNGMYNGLGFTADDQGTDDVFVFAVFDADGTIVGEATM